MGFGMYYLLFILVLVGVCSWFIFSSSYIVLLLQWGIFLGGYLKKSISNINRPDEWDDLFFSLFFKKRVQDLTLQITLFFTPLFYCYLLPSFLILVSISLYREYERERDNEKKRTPPPYRTVHPKCFLPRSLPLSLSTHYNQSTFFVDIIIISLSFNFHI